MCVKKKTTTKHDLVIKVAKGTGLTRGETRIAVDEVLEIFAEELERGRDIEMRGFGTFYTKERAPRPARNPRTGEVVPLERRVVPLFKFSGGLKRSIGKKQSAE